MFKIFREENRAVCSNQLNWVMAPITCTFKNRPTLRNFLLSNIYIARKAFKYGVIPGLYFPVFGLNTDLRSKFQSKYRETRTRNNSVFGHFSRSVTETVGHVILLFSSFWFLIMLVDVLHISLAIKIIFHSISLHFNSEGFDLICLFFSLDSNNDCCLFFSLGSNNDFCFATNDWLLCRLPSNTTPVTKMVSLPDALYDFTRCGSLDWWCNATLVPACKYLWNYSIWTYRFWIYRIIKQSIFSRMH